MNNIKEQIEHYIACHSEITDDTHERTVRDILLIIEKHFRQEAIPSGAVAEEIDEDELTTYCPYCGNEAMSKKGGEG